MKNNFSKRLLAFFIAICFIFGQSNLPTGLFHLNLDGILETKAAETFEDSTNGYPIIYTITGNNTVSATGYNVDNIDANKKHDILRIADTNGQVTHNGKTYTVTAVGDGAFAGFNYITGIYIPKTVETIGSTAFANINNLMYTLEFQTGSVLKTIGKQAFSGCSDLGTTSSSKTFFDLRIPASVETVEEEAFIGCSDLQRVTFEGTTTTIKDKVFYKDTKLTTVKLPTNATTLGSSVFEGCTGLVAVNLPTKLTEIADCTFKGCSKLVSDEVDKVRQSEEGNTEITYNSYLNFPSGIQTIGKYAFSSAKFTKLILPEELVTIKSNAFYNCSEFGKTDADFKFNNKLNVIEESAFENCSSLGGRKENNIIYYWNIVPPNTLTTIGKKAFYSCTQICSFRFDKATNITSIGEYAFSGTNLTSFALPDTIETVSPHLFEGCGSFSMLSISRNLTSIGAYAFNGCSSFATLQTRKGAYDGYDPENPPAADTNLSNSKIKSIGEYAFSGTGLTNFDLPAGVTIIYEGTFNKCVKLTTFTFHGNTLTYLGNSAFANCTMLKSIALPESSAEQPLYYMGSEVFNNCSALTTFSFGTNTTITELPSSTFKDCSVLTSVTLPDSITSLNSSVFLGCSMLTTVNNTTQLTSIGSSAFENCTSFTGLNGETALALPDTLATLGNNAFKGCTSLGSVTSLGAISQIPTSAFENCTALSNLTVNAGVTSINAKAFSNAPLASLTFNTVKAPKMASSTSPCFTFSLSAEGLVITCYEDVVTDLQEQFKSIGLDIPTDKFHTKPRPAGSIYQQDTTKFSLNIGASKTLYEGTNKAYALLDTSGNLSSEKFSWISSNKDVASVDSSTAGKITITAHDIGEVSIVGTSSIGNVTFTITVKPNDSNSVTNPYKDLVVYDITETTDLDEAPVLYSDDSSIPTTTVSDMNLYYLDSVAKERKLFVGYTLTDQVNATTDAFYWNSTDGNAELSIAGNSSMITLNDTLYITGQQVIIKPTATSGSAKIALSTKTGQKTTLTYKIGNAISSLSYGEKAKNGEIRLIVGNNITLSSVNYLVKEPNSVIEGITFSTSEREKQYIDLENGVVTGKALGTVTVTATSNYTGHSLDFTIIVTNPINSTIVSDSTGETLSNISLYPEDTYNLVFNWTYKDSLMSSEDYLACSFDTEGIVEIIDSELNQEDQTLALTIKALAIGTTNLVYEPASGSTNGKGKFKITVQQPLDSLTIKEGSASKTISVKDTVLLKGNLVASPTNHKDKIEWESNNTSVATVDDSGSVTGVGVGSCTIRAICRRTNKYAEFTITVTNPVTSAQITPDTVGSSEEPFYPGDSKVLSLKPTAQDANTALADNAVTWVSSAPDIVTVSNGSNTGATIQAVKAGSATIRVMNALNKQVASISVKVNTPSIKLASSKITMYTKIKARKTYSIKPIINGFSKTATYSSSKKKIATVSASGKITAKKKGTTVITVTANGVSTTLNVTVSTIKPKTTLYNSAGTIKKNKITVKKSMKTCTTKCNTNWTVSKATYKSSKKSVATISKTGVIKLKKKGTTKITITVDGIKKTYTLKVK